MKKRLFSLGTGGKLLVAIIALMFLFGMYGCDATTPGAFETSKVDTSPLKQLKDISLNDPDGLIAKLEMLKSIKGATVITNPDSKADETDWQGGEGCVWCCWYNEGVLAVGVYVYDTPQNAITAFNESDGLSSSVKSRGKTVSISNDVKAMLYPAYQYRSADNFYRYDGRRFLSTDVRMGNVAVFFSEQSNTASNWGVPTSQNLKQICQILKME